MLLKKCFFIAILSSILLVVASCTKDPSCSDGIQNQGEIGIDCCGPCFEQPCFDIPDCEAAVQASCFDGILNQDETEIDCGGAICPACEVSDTTDTPINDSIFFTITTGGETINFNESQITATLDSTFNQLEVNCNPDPDGFLPTNTYSFFFDIDEMVIGTLDLATSITSIAYLNDVASPCSSDTGSLTITAGGIDENFIEGLVSFECAYLLGDENDVFTEGSFYFAW